MREWLFPIDAGVLEREVAVDGVDECLRGVDDISNSLWNDYDVWRSVYIYFAVSDTNPSRKFGCQKVAAPLCGSSAKAAAAL